MRTHGLINASTTAALLVWLLGPYAPARGEVAAPKALDERLQVELVAAEPDLVTPTGIAVDDRGRVLVIESHTHFRPKDYQGPPADRIRSFEDRDGDGRHETLGTFFEGTQHTMNLAVYRDGSVYVATRGEIFRLRDKDNDGRADERTPIAHLETAGNYPHNGLSGFAFDAQGDVYFGFGENLGADYKLVGSDGAALSGGGEGGNIYRCRPDGSGVARLATGFWNPFHLCFDTFGRLFAVDNDPDSRPPCRLLHVVTDGDYGYRFRNGRKGLHPFTAWNGELPGTLPMVAGTGEAPSGMLSYESDNLPEEYRGTLLVTSWGDHRLERYRLRPQGASFRATMEPIIVGGENFRPVGIALAPDGSLYVSDWVDKSYNLHGKGRLWRIRAKDAKEPKRPTDPREALLSAHGPLRERAARQLAGDAAGREFLRKQLADSPNSRVRAAAIGSLAAADDREVDFVELVQKEKSPDIRAIAARLAPQDARLTHLMDGAVEALSESFGRSKPDVISLMLAWGSVTGDDPFMRHAAMIGLRPALPLNRRPSNTDFWRLLGKYLAQPERLKPRERLIAALLWKDSHSPEAVNQLPALLRDPDADVRFVAVQWIAEQRLTQFRQQLIESLATGATTQRLFEAHLAALAMLDGKSPKDFDEFGGEAYIAKLVPDAKTSPSIRLRALRMLRPDHPALTETLLKGFLNGDDADLKREAVRTLRDSPRPQAKQLLVQEVFSKDSGYGDALLSEAVVALSPSEPRQRELLLAYAAGSQTTLRREALRGLRGAKLTDAERARLSSQRDAEAELWSLIDAPPAAPAGDEKPDVEAWLKRLEGPADAAAGQRIFYHLQAGGCARCHTLEGRGARLGPDLSTTAAVLDRRRLVESVLLPSKEIAPQFVPWTIVTTDGRTLSGVLVSENADGEQTYADAKGETFKLRPAEIESRHPHALSIMPQGLERNLTLQEFRDLLAFLQSPRK